MPPTIDRGAQGDIDVRRHLLNRKVRIQVHDVRNLVDDIEGTIKGYLDCIVPTILTAYDAVLRPFAAFVEVDSALPHGDVHGPEVTDIEVVVAVLWDMEDLRTLIRHGATRPLACHLYVPRRGVQLDSTSITWDDLVGLSKESELILVG